jgi:hypothetical protein
MFNLKNLSMKKVILFGMCIVLFSCSKSENEETNNKQKLVARGSQSNTLKYQLVKNMIDNYRTNQLNSIQNSNINAVENDAQAIWFDIETLKKFIADVESQTQNNSNMTVNNLGIRFYYAAYPELNRWGTSGYEELSDLLNDPVTQLYEKKHTLIMIPTINVEGIDKDFNPMDKNTYEGFNSTINNSNYQIMSVSNSTLSTTAKNHGVLFPPDCINGIGF